MTRNETENLRRVTRLGLINAYLVREDDGLTLIDTAIKGSARAILAAAQQLGQPIRRILLTHAHVDHAGAVDALIEALPEVEFATSERSVSLLAGAHTLRPGEAGGKLRGGWIKTGHAPNRVIREGDRIGSLEVIETPGHAPGHLSFLDLRDRSLIAGDVFSNVGGLSTTSRVVPLFPFPALATSDREALLQSALKLCDLSPSRLALGHGPVIEQPEQAMRIAIEKASP